MIRRLVLTLLLLLPGWADLNASSIETAKSPIQSALEAARKAAAERPEDTRALLALARALMAQAEASGKASLYQESNQALTTATGLGGFEIEIRRLEVELLLAQRQFKQALKGAIVFNRSVPDDLRGYAYLVDSHLALGNLQAAEIAAQWMLDLRPENTQGRLCAARLREAFGDLKGALEMMSSTPGAFAWRQPLLRARSLAYMGHLLTRLGRQDEARDIYAESLQTLPGYPVAQQGLASLSEPSIPSS